MKCFFCPVLSVLLLLSLPAGAAMLTVTVEGLNGEALKNVLAALDIEKEAQGEDLRPGRVRRLHARAPAQIRRALQPFGYYRVEVSADLLEEEEVWEATYLVQPGDPVTVGSLEVTLSGAGQDDEAFESLLADFPLQEGDVLEHARYEQAKRSLQRLASERGYLDAGFVLNEVRVDLREYTAAVRLHFDTGRRYRFGPVSFRQDTFDDDFLQRYVKFEPGDHYSARAVLALQGDLGDSGYFRSVEVRPEREQAVDDTVPITVTTKPGKPRRWNFGLGYGTDTGPRGKIGHSRRVGRRGKRAKTELLVSRDINSLTTGFVIPLKDPVTEELGFSTRWSDEDTNSYTSRIIGVTVSHSRIWRKWRRALSMNYEREDFDIADEDDDSEMLFPAVSLERTRSDDRIRPRKGIRMRGELRGASENLLSDTSFLQLRLGAKWVRALTARNRVLLRTDLGGTVVTDFDSLPASQRFYAGGDNSVRGFAHEALGPENGDGEVTGGKYLAVGSIEFEHDLNASWSLAAFYDVGNAFNSASESMGRGTGAGLRWQSPVGPVRIDFAWAVSKPDNDFRLHFTLGPDL